MIPALRPLFMLLLLLGAVIWVGSIIWAGSQAGLYSLPANLPALYPEQLTAAAVAIGTALATWLGAAFGIRTREGKQLSPLSIPRSDPAVIAGASGNWEWAQIVGAWLYVLGLLAAAVMFFWAGTPDEPALLGDSLASLIGLIVGAVSVVAAAS